MAHNATKGAKSTALPAGTLLDVIELTGGSTNPRTCPVMRGSHQTECCARNLLHEQREVKLSLEMQSSLDLQLRTQFISTSIDIHLLFLLAFWDFLFQITLLAH
jgi:hypothetical protein